MSLIIKQDVKSYLKLTSDTKDTVIDALIPQVEKFALNHCNRPSFISGEISEYFNGGGRVFILHQLPVDITKTFKVYEDYDRVFGEDTLVDSADYAVDPDSGILKFDYDTEDHFRSIKVIYTGGYESDAIPDDLKLALVEMVVLSMKEGEGGELGVSSRSLPDGSVNFLKHDVPKELNFYII